ncbi:unnamed protein product [Toxocara canis]|uniref:Brix domain-containing protein n=1 Tax=Toxocara canis TaxID=6265 RepID=A0A183UDA9_TOXCA|nr:unnamed protein product [Toxocara canis]
MNSERDNPTEAQSGEGPSQGKSTKILPLNKSSRRISRAAKQEKGRSIRLQKAAAKRARQDARRKLRDKLGDAAPPKEQPKTIESMREYDLTMVEADDEEVNYALQNTFKFCYELQKCIPDAEVFTRKGIALKKVVKQAKQNDYTDLIVVHEDRKMPNGIVLCHLPDGPTAFFKINSLKFTKNIKKKGETTGHHPEVILNNFNTRLGHTVARMFACLFPHQPMFTGRRVVTFHNQRDYIFFRHHR